MIKLLSDDGKYLSDSMVTSLAIMLEMANAVTIMGFQMERAVERLGLHINLVHNHKRAFNEVRRLLPRLVSQFFEAFEDDLLSAAQGNALRHDAINSHSNDIIQLLLIYYSKVGDRDENRDRIKAKINKGYIGDKDFPLDDMMEFFKMK